MRMALSRTKCAGSLRRNITRCCVIYRCMSDNILRRTGLTIQECAEASKTRLPGFLINHALSTSSDVGGFLRKLIEMQTWDAKQIEEFFCKYPGLRPRPDEK